MVSKRTLFAEKFPIMLTLRCFNIRHPLSVCTKTEEWPLESLGDCLHGVSEVTARKKPDNLPL
jgi:hypothetical protein